MTYFDLAGDVGGLMGTLVFVAQFFLFIFEQLAPINGLFFNLAKALFWTEDPEVSEKRTLYKLAYRSKV
jgi:hypothetical protein